MHRFILVIVVIVVGLLCVATPAHAGMCLDDGEIAASVKELEHRATSGRLPRSYEPLCLLEVAGSHPTFGPRVLAACTTILTRTPTDQLCLELAISLGTQELGGVKLYDAIAGWMLDVWNWDGSDRSAAALMALGDARGAARIIEAWQQAAPEAVRREKRNWTSSMMAWTGWRKQAATALGRLGDATARSFLDDRANATKDRHLREACRAAIAAIDARLPTRDKTRQ